MAGGGHKYSEFACWSLNSKHNLIAPSVDLFLGAHSKPSKAGLASNINNYLAKLYFPVSQYVLSSFAIILKRKR